MPQTPAPRLLPPEIEVHVHELVEYLVNSEEEDFYNCLSEEEIAAYDQWRDDPTGTVPLPTFNADATAHIYAHALAVEAWLNGAVRDEPAKLWATD